MGNEAGRGAVKGHSDGQLARDKDLSCVSGSRYSTQSGMQIYLLVCSEVTKMLAMKSLTPLSGTTV